MFGMPELLFLGATLALVAAVGLYHRDWRNTPASTCVSRAYLDRLMGMSASESGR